MKQNFGRKEKESTLPRYNQFNLLSNPFGDDVDLILKTHRSDPDDTAESLFKILTIESVGVPEMGFDKEKNTLIQQNKAADINEPESPGGLGQYDSIHTILETPERFVINVDRDPKNYRLLIHHPSHSHFRIENGGKVVVKSVSDSYYLTLGDYNVYSKGNTNFLVKGSYRESTGEKRYIYTKQSMHTTVGGSYFHRSSGRYIFTGSVLESIGSRKQIITGDSSISCASYVLKANTILHVESPKIQFKSALADWKHEEVLLNVKGKFSLDAGMANLTGATAFNMTSLGPFEGLFHDTYSEHFTNLPPLKLAIPNIPMVKTSHFLTGGELIHGTIGQWVVAFGPTNILPYPIPTWLIPVTNSQIMVDGMTLSIMVNAPLLLTMNSLLGAVLSFGMLSNTVSSTTLTSILSAAAIVETAGAAITVMAGGLISHTSGALYSVTAGAAFDVVATAKAGITAATADITAAMLTLTCGTVDIGMIAIEPAVCGLSLMSWLDAHFHGCGVGPTSPPVVPSIAGMFCSQTVKVQN